MAFKKYAEAESYDVLPKDTQEELARLLQDKEANKKLIKEAYVSKPESDA